MIKKYVDKKDSIFTLQESKDIWDYTNEKYLKKEKYPTDMTFTDMLNKISKDLGLTTKQVRVALSQPEGVKELIVEFERTMNRRAKAVKKAKYWVKTADYPRVIKFLKLNHVWTFIKKSDKKRIT